MGADYSCFGESHDANKNTFVNNADLGAMPEDASKNPDGIEEGLIEKAHSEAKDAAKVQGAMRGYLSRKAMQPQLFEVKDARTWVKVEDRYELAEKPIVEVQNSLVGKLEQDLKPLDIQKPDDGVQVKPKPALKLEDGSVYEGTWDKQGKKHGVGTLIKEDGSKIVGCFKAGLLEGMARMIQTTGLVFEGEFKNGELNGNGTIKNKKGAKFDGELANGKLHGKGVEEWPDGTKYDGEYKNGVKHGNGTLTLPDGNVYVGCFKDDQMSGEGTLKYKNGNSYSGKWKKSKMHGFGVFKWNDGREYEGEFKDDLKHGKGKMSWADGKIYDGEWREGKQHGVAQYTYMGKDQKLVTRSCRWEEGSRVEWLKN